MSEREKRLAEALEEIVEKAESFGDCVIFYHPIKQAREALSISESPKREVSGDDLERRYFDQIIGTKVTKQQNIDAAFAHFWDAWYGEYKGKATIEEVARIIEDCKMVTALQPKQKEMGGEWFPIETAPRDGTNIKLKVEHEFPARWDEGFVSEDEAPCGGWVCTNEDYPESWTEGACWAFNEYGMQSEQPTHWKPLSALAPKAGEVE